MIKIAIADDHPLVLNGLADMLSAHDHIMIQATYPNGDSAIAGVRAEQPDVLILDIQMPDKRGEEVVLILRKEFPELKILVLTNFDNTLYASAMLRNGALGYLLKNTNRETLVQAIETVYTGATFLPAELKSKLADFESRVKANKRFRHTLTPRETDILKLLAAGKNNQQIAAELFLSKRTVENYRFNLTIKLDVKSTEALVKYAIEMGIA